MAGNSNSGQRTKLTKGLLESICDLIRAGNYADTACGCVGIGESTYYNWLARGREDLEAGRKGSIYVDFLGAIQKARDEAESRCIQIIQKAAIDGEWTAAAWFLERTKTAKYGKKQQLEHSGNVGVALNADKLKQLSDDELRTIVEGKGISRIGIEKTATNKEAGE